MGIMVRVMYAELDLIKDVFQENLVPIWARNSIIKKRKKRKECLENREAEARTHKAATLKLNQMLIISLFKVRSLHRKMLLLYAQNRNLSRKGKRT